MRSPEQLGCIGGGGTCPRLLLLQCCPFPQPFLHCSPALEASYSIRSSYSPCEVPDATLLRAWILGLSAHSAEKQGSLWSPIYFALPSCFVQMEQGSSVLFGKDCTHSAICMLLLGILVATSCELCQDTVATTAHLWERSLMIPTGDFSPLSLH